LQRFEASVKAAPASRRYRRPCAPIRDFRYCRRRAAKIPSAALELELRFKAR
jgi:hypothetical protein